jgi:anti-sigma factor RsiW
MRCAEAGPLVDRFVDRVLPAEHAALLEAHVAGCAACRARLEAARRLAGALSAERSADRRLKAPRGFAAAVMDEVFRQALWGPKPSAAPSRAAVPTRVYRRLGLSLVLSAGVLCAVLVTQPQLIPGLHAGHTAPFTRDGTGVVRAAIDGADQAVERALRSAGGPATGTTKGGAR